MLFKKLFRSTFRRLPACGLTFNLGKVATRLVFKPENQSTPTHFCFGNLFEMKVDLAEFASNDFFVLDKHFESTTLKLWTQLSKEANTIFDMGSHMGLFTLHSAVANPKAKIFPVEICRRNLEYLKENTHHLPQVQIINKAIGTEKGSFLFQEDALSGGGFLATTDLKEEIRVRVATENSYEVDALPLADIVKVAGVDEIDLVKMDLEGLEHELINGQAEFWETTPPKNLIVEIGFDKSQPEKLDLILTTMKARGYEAKRIQGLYAFPWKEEEDLANWWFKKVQ